MVSVWDMLGGMIVTWYVCLNIWFPDLNIISAVFTFDFCNLMRLGFLFINILRFKCVTRLRTEVFEYFTASYLLWRYLQCYFLFIIIRSSTREVCTLKTKICVKNYVSLVENKCSVFWDYFSLPFNMWHCKFVLLLFVSSFVFFFFMLILGTRTFGVILC